MVELDIAVRNISSSLAKGDDKELLNVLLALKNQPFKKNPKHIVSFKSMNAKFQKANYYRYLRKIYTYAYSMEKSLQNNKPRNSKKRFRYLYKKYQSLLENCRGCHHSLRVVSEI